MSEPFADAVAGLATDQSLWLFDEPGTGSAADVKNNHPGTYVNGATGGVSPLVAGGTGAMRVPFLGPGSGTSTNQACMVTGSFTPPSSGFFFGDWFYVDQMPGGGDALFTSMIGAQEDANNTSLGGWSIYFGADGSLNFEVLSGAGGTGRMVVSTPAGTITSSGTPVYLVVGAWDGVVSISPAAHMALFVNGVRADTSASFSGSGWVPVAIGLPLTVGAISYGSSGYIYPTIGHHDAAFLCVTDGVLLDAATALDLYRLGAGLSVAAPTVTSASPSTVSPGVSVVLTGTHFLDVTSVTVGGVVVSGVSVLSAVTIAFTAPSGAPPGAASVLATTPSGTNPPNQVLIYSAAASTVVPVCRKGDRLAAETMVVYRINNAADGGYVDLSLAGPVRFNRVKAAVLLASDGNVVIGAVCSLADGVSGKNTLVTWALSGMANDTVYLMAIGTA